MQKLNRKPGSRFSHIWNNTSFIWKRSQTRIRVAKSQAHRLYLAGLKKNISMQLPGGSSVKGGQEHMYHRYIVMSCSFLIEHKRCCGTWVWNTGAWLGGGSQPKEVSFHSEDEPCIHTYLCQCGISYVRPRALPVKVWGKLCVQVEWLGAHF